MTQQFIKILILGLFLISFANISDARAQFWIFGEDRMQRRAENRLEEADQLFSPWMHLGPVGIDSVDVQRDNELIQVFFTPEITHLPIRYPWIQYLENELMNMLGRRFRNYDMELFARDRHLKEFIPNYFRHRHVDRDTMRIRVREPVPSLVRRNRQPRFDGGLSDNHVAVWHSHGYYYDAGKDRWQWQRARLFGAIEDMLTMEYVVKYIAPMLENAGANVLIPRERDIQVNEVVVDVSSSSGQSELMVDFEADNWEIQPGGFALRDTLFDGDNPFRMGNHLRIPANSDDSLVYVPDIPESGRYAVYVSWAESSQNIPDAHYVVNYKGGNASFRVNQQMGFGTWIYLGHFYFSGGKDRHTGSVILYTDSEDQGYVTADAVRFGGGKGNIARRASGQGIPNLKSDREEGNATFQQAPVSGHADDSRWRLSDSPRYIEASRYYLQYAGMPDSLVYSLNEGMNDYNDDYMSRGEWVNYLMGAPLGPEEDREVSGLNIPIDLSFSFHTDAGVTPADSVIGTLAIHSTQRDDGLFPDSVSRLASRDLCDIIKDQLITDIRASVNPQWTSRAIWDRQYAEAWRPNVPAMLLELYSHQNLADIRYGLDPRFQFITGRAIYKGILRFIAHNEDREAVVQPLPPSRFAISETEGKTIRLSWQGVDDPLEPSATPDYFKVYMKQEGHGFDQVAVIDTNHIDIELPSWGDSYSFKVSAVNRGGESFSSETLSVALLPDRQKTVLVVNGFDRLSGPGVFDTGEMAGMTWWDDLPIPYGYSVFTTGMQYDYHRDSPWLDDDSPGWGASYGDIEKQVVAGNTFNYPAIHGNSITNAGYSFVSISREAFEEGDMDIEDYFAVNVIMGKQKGIPSWLDKDSLVFRTFSEPLIEKLTDYARNGGNILLSGAYVGSDMVQHHDNKAIEFASDWLGYTWRSNNASNTGDVYPTNAATLLNLPDLVFNTEVHPEIYVVEAPDAIEASGDFSSTVYRYASNKTSAAVVLNEKHKAFTLGFPFETILDPDDRDALMQRILLFFEEP